MNPNSYPSPKAGTKTRRVWEIADAITQASGRPATRSEVARKFADEGGNRNTANTQYTYWKANLDTRTQDRARPIGSSPGPLQIQVREAGRIVVPIEFRNALNIAEGDTLAARMEDGEIRLLPLSTAIKKAQALVRQYIPAGVALVDELLEERRAEERE